MSNAAAKPMSSIAGPPPVNNVFQLLNFMRQMNSRQIEFLQGWYDEYGDVILLDVMNDPTLLVSNPEMMREILVTKAKSFYKSADYRSTEKGLARAMGQGLVTSEGDYWKRQRKLVQPAFHTKRIVEYADTMAQYTEEQVAAWDGKERIDIAHEMAELTLRIVAKTIFNTAVADDDAEKMFATVEAVQDTAGGQTFFPSWVPTPTELRTRRALKAMDEIMEEYIAERRENPMDRGDLLSMLLLTEDEDGNGMTDKQVRDEAVTMFLAGHETTANTMNWTFMLLAQNPQIEVKLHEELDRVLGGRTPTLQDLRELPYTEMVIKEAMRLMPPVPGAGRMAIEDVQIGDYLIPKNTNIFLFWYHTHHEEKYWEDAETFKPERFSPENEANIDRYTYLPFGGGPRVCIGNSFAMMEAHLLLATIAQKYKLRLVPNHKIVPDVRVTMFPRGGLPMTIHQRESIAQPQPEMA